MDTIKLQNNKIKMIAHRGLSGILQENTIPAFELAASKSYLGIETDVHVTKDKRYIICHDDNIKRVTGVDKVIEESLYDELSRIPVFNKDGSLNENMHLPSLEEYLDICHKNNKISVLELKNDMEENEIVEIVEVVKKFNHYESTIFISFSSKNIINFRKNFKDGNCQFLSDLATIEKIDEAFNIAINYNVDLDVYYVNLTQEFVDKCKANNILINVWTVDDKEKALELIKMGVDYITSNILE